MTEQRIALIQHIFKTSCYETKHNNQIDLGNLFPHLFPKKSLICIRKKNNCKYKKGDIIINGVRKSGIGNIVKGITKHPLLSKNWDLLKMKYNKWYDPYYDGFVLDKNASNLHIILFFDILFFNILFLNIPI